MKYSYDTNTKALFSFDKDFQYEGLTEYPPVDAEYIDSSQEFDLVTGSWTGAYFLSGFNSKALNIHCNDKENFYIALSSLTKDKKIQHEMVTECESWPSSYVIISGKIVKDPVDLAFVLNYFHNKKIFVCPFVEVLPTFGGMVVQAWQNPRRIEFETPWTKIIKEVPSKPFYKQIENDSAGRIAYDIFVKNRPVLTQMICSLGFNPLDNKVLSAIPLTDKPIFCISYELVNKYFPYENIVFKKYVATAVPMYLTPGDEFKKIFKCDDKVLVYVITDYDCDILTGLTETLKNLEEPMFVCHELKSFFKDKLLPVYRHNAIYKVDQEWINKHVELELSFNGPLDMDDDEF